MVYIVYKYEIFKDGKLIRTGLIRAEYGSQQKIKEEIYQDYIKNYAHGPKLSRINIEIESITEMTDEMVNDSDVVYGFLSYISDFGLDEMHMLPINILYELYKIWHHQENPGGSPLKQKSFTTRLRTNCVKFGFKFSTDRVRLTSLSTLEYSQNIINYLILDKPLNINTKQKVYYLYNNENKIPKSEVDLFKKQLIEINSIDTVSTRELIILDYLRLNGNTKAASLFD